MVAQTRPGTRRGTRGRSSRNNNSEDRKQNSKPMRAVRESPLAAAAVIGGTVAAGVFLGPGATRSAIKSAIWPVS